jgi:nickel superoxide dismutase
LFRRERLDRRSVVRKFFGIPAIPANEQVADLAANFTARVLGDAVPEIGAPPLVAAFVLEYSLAVWCSYCLYPIHQRRRSAGLAVINPTKEEPEMTHRKKVLGTAFALGVVTVAAVLSFPQVIFAHCQIPCGIYDDPARFTELREHITTIEKGMNEIKTLSAEPVDNANQLVRWVANKDDHADQFAGIITYYFLQQRIKTPEGDDAAANETYVNHLTLCHKMLVTTMKCKQTIDLENPKALRELVDAFEKAYNAK